jgi:hypothetical protein
MYRANVFPALNLARLLEARFEHARAANIAPLVEVSSAPHAVSARTALQMIFQRQIIARLLEMLLVEKKRRDIQGCCSAHTGVIFMYIYPR